MNNNMNNIGRSIIQFCLLLLLMGNTSYLSAIDLPEFRIINAGLGKQFALSIGSIPQEMAEFKVVNEKGRTVLSTKIEGQDFQRLFNLEDLQEGNYTFVLKTQSSEIIQPVRLTKRAVLYDLNKREVIYLPSLEIKDRQLTIRFATVEQTNCRLELRTDKNELLYKETLTEAATLEKRMNLMNLPTGTFFVKVNGADYHWQQEIALP